MLTIKLSDDQAAKLGLKTQDDAIAALEAAAATKEKLTEAQTENASLAERVEKVEASVEKLTTDLSARVLDQNAILEESRKVAKGAASEKAAEIIAKTGQPAAAASATGEPAALKDKPTFQSEVQKLVASGKTRAEAVSATIKAKPDLYAAWKTEGMPNF